MKELLYLKDEQIKDCIQLLLYAYRETFSDPKDILKKNSMGAAHHRTLHLIERNEGISVNELLIKLKIKNLMKIILIMGLPGAGKTTLAEELAPKLNAKRLNADEVRKAANDWDFSEEGRKRQSKRMANAALKLKEEGNYVVADFICPTPEARNLFPADYTIWVDTIKEGRFDDTNKMFVKPAKYDFHVTTQDAKNWAPKIFEELK